MKEKPLISFLTNTGIYIVEPEVVDDIGDGENIWAHKLISPSSGLLSVKLYPHLFKLRNLPHIHPVILTDRKYSCFFPLLSFHFNDVRKLAFVSVGSIKSTEKRRELHRLAQDSGFAFPNIIDPSAAVSEHACLGQGIFIGKNAVINAGAQIGDMAIINSGAVIEHGCLVGDFTRFLSISSWLSPVPVEIFWYSAFSACTDTRFSTFAVWNFTTSAPASHALSTSLQAKSKDRLRLCFKHYIYTGGIRERWKKGYWL
mgnify:CR=1 FL=1